MGGQAHIVIGSNRGIGLGLVRELVATVDPSDVVFATARQLAGAQELHALAKESKVKLELLAADVTDEASIKAVARSVRSSGHPVSTLYINAGASFGRGDLLNVKGDDLTKSFAANVLGPLYVFQSFSDQLVESKAKVVLTSTALASVAGVVNVANTLKGHLGTAYRPAAPYSTSKAAGNMLFRQFAAELEPKGVTFVAIHPGIVATDMAGNAGFSSFAISVDESVKGMLAVARGVDVEATHKGILAYDGKKVYPW